MLENRWTEEEDRHLVVVGGRVGPSGSNAWEVSALADHFLTVSGWRASVAKMIRTAPIGRIRGPVIL